MTIFYNYDMIHEFQQLDTFRVRSIIINIARIISLSYFKWYSERNCYYVSIVNRVFCLTRLQRDSIKRSENVNQLRWEVLCRISPSHYGCQLQFHQIYCVSLREIFNDWHFTFLITDDDVFQRDITKSHEIKNGSFPNMIDVGWD